MLFEEATADVGSMIKKKKMMRSTDSYMKVTIMNSRVIEKSDWIFLSKKMIAINKASNKKLKTRYTSIVR
jgi:hypothetical protein